MSITKPFTFVAGTKARANEVNQNFDVLYSQVNSNISAINTNTNDIDTLDSNKANVNGSSSQRFACADPTSPSDAVNKQSLTKAIGNSINYIDGYVISKDSGSPNDTILVTAGSCYDYTKSVVLAKNTSTTKQNTSQGASTTYYIYVIGNDSGTSVDVLISPNAVVPTLPTGYTKFRQIGSYTTDSDGYISSIYYYGTEANSNKGGSAIALSIMPDWSKKESIAVATEYTANNYGYLYIRTGVYEGAQIVTIIINGETYDLGSGLTNREGGHSTVNFLPISLGDIYKINSGTGYSWYTAYFIPMKGVV